MEHFEEITEDLKIDWLRNFSDGVVQKIKTSEFEEFEAIVFLESVKHKILEKFPEKERQYEMIYGRRFKRLLSKKGIWLELFSEKITRN